jgi:hypothetical protein
MPAPRTCDNCGTSPVHSKGLCSRCYQKQGKLKRPDGGKPAQGIDRTAYLEAVAARNRDWLEQAAVKRRAKEQEASRLVRERMRASRER